MTTRARPRRRRWCWGGLASCVCITLLSVVVLAGTATAAVRPPILGFQVESDPVSAISASAAGLASVGIAGLTLTGPGQVSAVNAAELNQLSAARECHLGAQLLVSNYSNKIKDFSERLVHETLRSPALVAKLATRLQAEVEAYGWNGIILDLEALKPRDAAGFVELATALREGLPDSVSVGVTLTNNGDPGEFAAEGYDLSGLAASHAQLILMAYDQHGPWEKTPGPVGSLEWTRTGLDVLLSFVPGSRIVLGVAGYGYAWRRHRVETLSDAQARALAASRGAHVHWVPSVGEWTARLHDGSTVWWSDARSLQAKIKLAESLHLGGLAVWSLANSDPITANG
jgi:spore germination protein YaaH